MFTSKIDKIKKDSKKVLSIFEETINSLIEINNEASVEKTDREERIFTLKEEISSLESVISENNVVIKNIKKIFNDEEVGQ